MRDDSSTLMITFYFEEADIRLPSSKNNGGGIGARTAPFHVCIHGDHIFTYFIIETMR